MQELINMYFSKLCSEKFFKNDEDEIIGKAKDVIKYLKEQVEYVKNPKNKINSVNRDFVIDETNELVQKINEQYSDKEDVIWLRNHPMAGFFILQNKENLFKELKEYYEEI